MTAAPVSSRRSRRLVLVFTAASAVALWLLLRAAFTLPDDAALEARLSANRGAFAELLELARGDPGLQAMELAAMRPEALPLPADRVERYRALLARCELRSLVRRGDEIELVAAAVGSGGRALVKGFVRPAAPPAPQVASLDALAAAAKPGSRAFKDAGEGWYLVLEVR